jgi:hypothetical protein
MVNVNGEGNVLSCSYYPEKDIEVILPGKYVANILVVRQNFWKISRSGNQPFFIALNHLV